AAAALSPAPPAATTCRRRRPSHWRPGCDRPSGSGRTCTARRRPRSTTPTNDIRFHFGRRVHTVFVVGGAPRSTQLPVLPGVVPIMTLGATMTFDLVSLGWDAYFSDAYAPFD